MAIQKRYVALFASCMGALVVTALPGCGGSESADTEQEDDDDGQDDSEDDDDDDDDGQDGSDEDDDDDDDDDDDNDVSHDSTPGSSETSDDDDDNDNDNDDDDDSTDSDDIPSGDNLLDRLKVSDVEAPAGAKEGVRNWRVWKSSSLEVAPVYTVPLSTGQTLICITTGNDSDIHAYALKLDADDALADTFDLAQGFECRGLAAEDDGSFGALLWRPDESEEKSQIFLSKFDAEGKSVWQTELKNDDNKPTDFGIGDSRVDFGDGKYGAYYHVHSDSGHEGDTLKWITATDGKEETEWGWGCSHSMSAVLRFNPQVDAFLSACVTDCYPGTDGSDFATTSLGGIYLERRDKVLDVDAGCNGSVAGELGSAALAPDGWKIVFNAHQAEVTLGQESYDPETMNQDIGFSAISGTKSAGAVVWLTDTPNVNEADPTIAAWQPKGESDEAYVVGWTDGAAGTYFLQRVDAAGQALAAPEELTGRARWGLRDDPMRNDAHGDIIWAWFDAAGDKTLHFARIAAGK